MQLPISSPSDGRETPIVSGASQSMKSTAYSNAERKRMLLEQRLQGYTPTLEPSQPKNGHDKRDTTPFVIDMTEESHIDDFIHPQANSNSMQAQNDAWMAHSSSTQSETSQHSMQEGVFRGHKRRYTSDEEHKERDRDSNLGTEDQILSDAPSNEGSVGRQVRQRTIPTFFGGAGEAAVAPNTSPLQPVLSQGSARGAVARPPLPTSSEDWGHEKAPAATTSKRAAGKAAVQSAPAVLSQDVRVLQEEVLELRRSISTYEHQVRGLQSELDETRREVDMVNEKNVMYMQKLEDVLRRVATQEAREKREKLAADSVRLGKLVVKWTGPTTMSEAWEDGYATKDMKRRTGELLERKEELDRRKKAVQAKKRQASRKGAADDDFELLEELYSINVHLDQLKRDEQLLAEERRTLEGAKAVHYKECKRIQHEEKSRLNRLPLLHNRYLLQALQGKGGFSEVWRGFDLLALRDVAVKVHQLNPAWSEEKKQNYTKHVTREYAIHKDLSHPRVVQLYDVFEIDVNSFATVLEFCRGTDLDEHLKKHKRLPERDARAILMQIMTGLRYLNTPVMENGERRQGVIHFDLKPGNILFDEMGDVKITDFGLSKIMDDTSDGTSMELTSQGAGTYWYLPPECFQSSPRISSKVDVWSVGVIFYQILYGRRPFGEGKTQDRILSEQVMLRATQVEFPAEPKITKEAQDFIRASLTYDQRMRPDVLQLCQHPYLRKK